MKNNKIYYDFWLELSAFRRYNILTFFAHCYIIFSRKVVLSYLFNVFLKTVKFLFLLLMEVFLWNG